MRRMYAAFFTDVELYISVQDYVCSWDVTFKNIDFVLSKPDNGWPC
jgi:hypothetical protein